MPREHTPVVGAAKIPGFDVHVLELIGQVLFANAHASVNDVQLLHEVLQVRTDRRAGMDRGTFPLAD